MNKKYKLLFVMILFILIVLLLLLSYYGLFFFTEKFNEFDYLMLNIIGDAILVGIATHLSSKNISMLISKKEFTRNNKINIAINKSRNLINNYKDFMNIYENKDIFFAIEEKDRKILDRVYKLYEYLLNTLLFTDDEKQLIDKLLNVPFIITYSKDINILEIYNEIINNFDENRNFENILILKKLLTENILKDLENFSNIILNIKKYEITNLNSIEGCQLLVTYDNIVACKIPCLPNHKYNLYIYYDLEHWIDFIAFSFDYDSKEYATNLLGIKYTNDTENFRPAKIKLSDFINVK